MFKTLTRRPAELPRLDRDATVHISRIPELWDELADYGLPRALAPSTRVRVGRHALVLAFSAGGILLTTAVACLAVGAIFVGLLLILLGTPMLMGGLMFAAATALLHGGGRRLSYVPVESENVPRGVIRWLTE